MSKVIEMSSIEIFKMEKVKKLLIILVITSLATFSALLIIKLLMSREIALFNPFYYLIGINLLVIMLFLGEFSTNKKLIITSILFPILMTFFIVWVGMSR